MSRIWFQLGKFRRAAEDESGATLVETALTITLMLAMLLGTFQLSMALYGYHYISNTARESSRWAMVRGSSCQKLLHCNASSSDIQTYARGLGYPGVDASEITVNTTWLSAGAGTPTTWTACAGTCNAPGNEVQVQVNYAFQLGIPFSPVQSVNMTSTSVMVISQ